MLGMSTVRYAVRAEYDDAKQWLQNVTVGDSDLTRLDAFLSVLEDRTTLHAADVLASSAFSEAMACLSVIAPPGAVTNMQDLVNKGLLLAPKDVQQIGLPAGIKVEVIAGRHSFEAGRQDITMPMGVNIIEKYASLSAWYLRRYLG